MSRESRLIRRMTPKPLGNNNFVLPNTSGDHVRSIKRTAPVDDKDLVNKEYVDGKEVESFPTSLTAGSVVYSDGTNLAEDNATLFWDDTNKYLGIGTNTPGARLQIGSAGNTIVLQTLRDGVSVADGFFRITNYTTGAAMAPIFWAKGNSTSLPGMAFIGDVKTDTGALPVIRFQARARNSTVSTRPLFTFENFTADPIMTILPDGNVGMGTTIPSTNLHVVDASDHAEAIMESETNTKFARWKLLNDAGVNAALAVYGSNFGLSEFRDNAAFGAENSIYVIANGEVGSGGAGEIIFLTGGYIPATQARMTIRSDGNIDTPKIRMTTTGGYAIRLTNKTGVATVAGQIVEASTTTDDAFGAIGLNDTHPIGVVLDAGVADDAEAWVVVSGIADVLIDAGGCAHGDRLITSGNTAGSADVDNSPAVAVHFQEIGHSIETRVGAGLARVVLHFL